MKYAGTCAFEGKYTIPVKPPNFLLPGIIEMPHDNIDIKYS
jgi:hypothetical protein